MSQIHTDGEGLQDLQDGAYAEPEAEEDYEMGDQGPLDELDYEAQQDAWLEEAHGQYLDRRKKRLKEEEPQEVTSLWGYRRVLRVAGELWGWKI